MGGVDLADYSSGAPLAGSVGDAQLIQMALDIEDDQFVTSIHADHNAELY